MAPLSSPLLHASQSQKKQQSISAFFGSKPENAAPPLSQSLRKQSGFGSAGQSAHAESPLAAVSSFQSQKRPHVVIAEDDGEQRPTKRIARELSRSSTSRDSQALDVGKESGPSDLDGERAFKSESLHSNGHKLKDPRTSRYSYSQDTSMPTSTIDEDEDSEEVRKQKERLHQKFIKKLGRPDSLADLRRRNKLLDEDEDAAEADEDANEDEAESPEPAKKKASGKKTGNKLTPMEKQVLDIKSKHKDTLLVVEVGYKYRFFGEDARIAAKELQIVCIPGKFRFDEHPSEAHLDRFASASIPVHRLHVHVKRLVQAGHKVGVVRQLETAALKAVGDNRNAPFVRQLTNLYTKGTYIDDTEGLDASSEGFSTEALSTGHLLCLTEINARGWGTDEQTRIGFIAVQPTTGDVLYDDFEDGFLRAELETRLLHISPCEYLIVGPLSKTTEKVIANIAARRSSRSSDQARIERVDKPKTMAAQAYSHISDFYAQLAKSGNLATDGTALLEKVHQLSELVTMCLSAMITHLTDYGLQHVFDLTKYFQSFSARSHMLLNGNTLTSLEIYNNQTDHSSTGSLFWSLNKTTTRFGQRLLRKWVGRPLLDHSKLKERLGAVEELINRQGTIAGDKIRHLLRQIKGDLEKSLIRIYYKKCTRPELVTVLQTLQMIGNEYADAKNPEASGFQSRLLANAIVDLPGSLEDVTSFLDRINLAAAKEDDKYAFLREEHESEAITDHKMSIVSIEHDLGEQKKAIAAKLHLKKVEYTTVAGIEYLIEVENTRLKHVPASWAKISGTKKMSRFHTPEVIKLSRERDQQREALANACDSAFTNLLTEIGNKYQQFRDCVQSLATLDCLLSLAEVSSLPNYSKPEFVTDKPMIEISGARHPMVEQLLLDAYVPNDVSLAWDATRALLVTGPNMGGKSSYVRSVALICIMAQIGCYVPAASARISLLDAVFTRMGAFDNMMKGESTFMVELSETGDILKQATPRSLVILDELGRGTSTHDGVAIAQAVLNYMLVECKSLTLFITHYQALAKMADKWPGHELKNVHMTFTENEDDTGESEVTFLYEVGEGTAHRSYGLNVAKLAGLPKGVIDVAAVKSKELETEELGRRMAYLRKLTARIVDVGGDCGKLDELVEGIEQLG